MPTLTRPIATFLAALCLHASAAADDAPVTRDDAADIHPWYATPTPRATAKPEPRLGAAIVAGGPEAFGEALAERRRQLAEHGPWLTSYGLSVNARQLLDEIAGVGVHGLDPERYELAALERAVATLDDAISASRGGATGSAADTLGAARADETTFAASGPDAIRNEALPAGTGAIERVARAALARRLDRAFERLATDFGRGAVDGRAVEPRLHHAPPEPPVARLRAALASGETDVHGALASLLPPHEEYARLVETMKKLLAERAAGVTRGRVGTGPELVPGDDHPDVERVRRRLAESGELAVGESATASPFDDALAAALRAFQRHHGLEPSGLIDRATREALDRGLEDDIRAVALSLERWRWLPRALGERHIIVNLPDYRLQVREGTRELLSMPVVIGAAEHATPSFSREMSYLEFNPTWTVPASIANRELLPRERRRPGYLRARAFDVLRYIDGQLRPMAENELSAEDLASRPFPYVLRQRGGPGNALGRVKFMMPNPFAIYLHDTPAKRHFALRERAYSNGCIRLAEPERLAELLLEHDGVGSDRVTALLEGERTRRVALGEPVPTHLVYLTSWVDDEGVLQTRPDVYGRDAALAAALTAAGSTLGALARADRMSSPAPLAERHVADADEAL